MKIETITFPQRKNETGSLAFLEANNDIPFEIKRVYYIYDVAAGARRGFHAHKKLQQILICIHGSCKILLDDGAQKEIVELTDRAEGLIVNPKIWHEMYDFSSNAILLVLASDYYDESDYLRSYALFLENIRGGK